MDWPIITNIVFTGMVAAATTGLVVVGARQLNAIRSQIGHTQQTLDLLKQQQCAWLTTTATAINELVTGLRENQDGVDVSEWGIEVRNTGPTPGIITHSRVEPLLRPIEENCMTELSRIEHRAREIPARRTVVAPGQSSCFA